MAEEIKETSALGLSDEEFMKQAPPDFPDILPEEKKEKEQKG